MKPLPLILAALGTGALVARRRRLSRRGCAIALAAVAALAVYGSGTVELPSLETTVRDLGATLGPWTYALVGLLAFLESGAGAGLIAPGELAVIVGGVTAGQGETDIVALIALVWASAFAGDVVSFLLGRRLGRGFIVRHSARVKLGTAQLERLEAFFSRHGGKTILVGRFVGFVRVFAPFVAGASKMPARRFLPYALVASGAWAATFSMLGYVFWQSVDAAAEIAKQGTLALGAAIALGTGAIALYRYLRSPGGRGRVRARLRGLRASRRGRGGAPVSQPSGRRAFGHAPD